MSADEVVVAFGGRLKQLRERTGMSQPALAKAVNMSVRQISRLETGESVATWPTVLALAAALGVDCTAFTKPPAEEQPEPKRGRPRKQAEGPRGESLRGKKT